MVKGMRFKKIFIAISIIFILGVGSYYIYRLVHYYRLENVRDESKQNSTDYFNNKLESTISLIDTTGGLYINDNEYAYKYAAKENYLWYSGHLWRIMKINKDKTMDIILENNLSLVHASYENNEYLEAYLTEFYEKLDHEMLVPLQYCYDQITDLNNITCKEKFDANIALLDISTYNYLGGIRSFLNNKSNFWLINKNEDGLFYYVNSKGELGVSDSLALGIRPIVRLKDKLELVSGSGTINNPYIIKENKKTQISEANIGEYVSFNDSKWRIASKNENSISLKSIECLKENGNCQKMTFGSKILFEKSNVNSYLNETYYNSIVNKDFLVRDKFYTGLYESHNYKNLLTNEFNAYVGIPKIADYYIDQDISSFLITNDGFEMIYTINEDGNYYLNLTNIEAYLYPIINLDKTLKISSGSGMINDPYVLTR